MQHRNVLYPQDMTIAVVGVGAIGSLHVSNLHALGVGQVVTIDPAQDMTPTTSVRLKELRELRKYNVDGCIVAAPTDLHHTVISDIRKITSSPILCEKPLSYTKASVKELLEQTDGLHVAFVERFNQPFIKLMQWCALTDGPYTMSFSRRTKAPPKGHWMRNQQNKGADIMLDLGIHDIDIATGIIGAAPTRVVDHSYTQLHESARLEFSDGSIVTIDSAWDLPDDHIAGIENSVRIERNGAVATYTSTDESLRITGDVEQVTPRFEHAYIEELRAFLQLISSDTYELQFPDMNDVLNAMRAYTMIKEERTGE